MYQLLKYLSVRIVIMRRTKKTFPKLLLKASKRKIDIFYIAERKMYLIINYKDLFFSCLSLLFGTVKLLG